MKKLLLTVGMLAVCGAAVGAGKKPKALLIMLDGMRADSVEIACAPNLRMLRDGKWQPGYKCAWSLSASTIRDAVTVSAPNHTSIATGVTAAKTNVRKNGQFKNCDYAKWPSWLLRVVNAQPQTKALFMFSWHPDIEICPSPKVEFIHGSDAANAIAMPKRLAAADAPDAIMWYIDLPDHGGHGHGYYPSSVGYLNTVYISDKAIGDALRAIASRPTFADEDWMIIVTADHGGYARGHGPMSAQCWTIPLLVTGRNVSQGRIPGEPHDYDASVTALHHFGIDTSSMNLDGKPLGAKVIEKEPVRCLKDGLAAYLPFDGKKPDNRIAEGPKGVLRGASTVTDRGGLLGGCLRVAADAKGFAGVELKGSEKLSFENGAEFAMALWVRMDANQDADPAIAGNKDWNAGLNPGIAMIGAKKISTIGRAGVCMNGALAGPRRRFDVGPYDIAHGEWTFYAATRGSDGVLSFYQGGRDGFLYRITDDTTGIKIQTGLPFHVGQDGTGRYSHVLKGDIDEFALWTRALSHEDVRKIYEAGRKGVPLGELL